MSECINCGAVPRWRDSLTGVHRCGVCIIEHGGGRAHYVLPTELHELDTDGAEDPTVVDPEDADDLPEPDADLQAVWDELAACFAHGEDVSAEAIEQGRMQARQLHEALRRLHKPFASIQGRMEFGSIEQVEK
jgi:hypothetical protein